MSLLSYVCFVGCASRKRGFSVLYMCTDFHIIMLSAKLPAKLQKIFDICKCINFFARFAVTCLRTG